MKKNNNDNSKVLNDIRIALYIIIGLFAVNIILGVTNVSNVFSLRNYSNENSGSGNNGGGSDEVGDTEPEYEYDVSKFTAVDYKGFKEEIAKDGYQVVYIGRESCGYCAMFIPMMQQGQDEYGFKTIYFDITKVINFTTGAVIDQEAHDEIVAIDKFFEDFGSTPMIAVFKDGEFIDGTIGYSEYATYDAFLESVGMTKK